MEVAQVVEAPAEVEGKRSVDQSGIQVFVHDGTSIQQSQLEVVQ